MTKRNDINNYLGGWPKWFQEQGQSEKAKFNDLLEATPVEGWAALREQQRLKAIAEHLDPSKVELLQQFPDTTKGKQAITEFSLDDVANVRKILDDYNERLVKSRDHICYLYLSYYKLRLRGEVNAGDVHELEFRATRLAEAKAKHLAEFGEELTLSFRKVV